MPAGLKIEGKDRRLIMNIYWKHHDAINIDNEVCQYSTQERCMTGMTLNRFSLNSENIVRNLDDMHVHTEQTYLLEDCCDESRQHIISTVQHIHTNSAAHTYLQYSTQYLQ